MRSSFPVVKADLPWYVVSSFTMKQQLQQNNVQKKLPYKKTAKTDYK